MRLCTSGAAPPTFSCSRPGVSFIAFSLANVDTVIDAVRQLPDKSSATNPMPTSVLKQVVDLFAPYFTDLFNHSLATDHFPSVFKEAFITPIVKKAGLETLDVNTNRPISNLSVVSKLLERLVVLQLMAYLSSADLLPTLQSGFRPGHSTETAVLQVLSELLQAVDRGDFGALVLLDQTAAFDTVDHNILLQRLQQTFGIDGAAHRCMVSFLSHWSDTVHASRNSPIVHHSSSLQRAAGIRLGPLLFILYIVDLIEMIEAFEGLEMSPHLYADDAQVGGSCRPSNVNAFSSSVSDCLRDVSSWMRSNRLQLNSSKTEVLWCSTSRRQHLQPTSALAVDGAMAVADLAIGVGGRPAPPRPCWVLIGAP